MLMTRNDGIAIGEFLSSLRKVYTDDTILAEFNQEGNFSSVAEAVNSDPRWAKIVLEDMMFSLMPREIKNRKEK